MEPGHLAGFIIVGSMSVGALAIIGFCLQFMFNRKFQCDAEHEIGSNTLAPRENHINNSMRYSSNKVFNISGRLPPPPPLSPPPPPADSSVVEISHFSNNSITYISTESDYESMQEMTSSSDDATTVPYVVFTTGFSTLSSSGQVQSERSRTYGVKIGGHLTSTMSITPEEEEKSFPWGIQVRSQRRNSPVVQTQLSLTTTGNTPEHLSRPQIPLHVPDTETNLLNSAVTQSKTFLSPFKSPTAYPTSETPVTKPSEEETEVTPKS